MLKYTHTQRLVIIQKYYERRVRLLVTGKEIYPHKRSTVLTFLRIVAKFEKDYTLHDSKPSIRHRNARSVDNIAVVRASVTENINLSVPRRSQELEFLTTAWRIMRIYLCLHSYSIVLTQ